MERGGYGVVPVEGGDSRPPSPSAVVELTALPGGGGQGGPPPRSPRLASTPAGGGGATAPFVHVVGGDKGVDGGGAHNRVFAEVAAPAPTLRSLAASLWAQYSGLSWRDAAIVDWLPRVTRSTLTADAVAALVVTVLLVPQAMAYSLLAGLDPVYGLYSSTLPLIVFGLFTTSSQVAVGPVAPTAILMEGMVRSLTTAPPRSPEFLTYHLVLAFLSGLIQLVLGALKFGVVASLLSWPVMSGFSSGAAIIIIVSQLNDLLQLQLTSSGNVFQRLVAVCGALPRASWLSAVLGLASLVFMLWGKQVVVRGRKLPKATPMPLVVIVIGTIISVAADLQGRGIRVTGPIPASLPLPSVPPLTTSLVLQCLPSATLLAVINYVQTVTLAVMFGKKCGERVSASKELFAIGSSSLLGSFFSCHTVAGSFTRTAVQAEAGARTPLATIFTGVFMMVCVLTLTRVFQFIPMCMLAAIVAASAKPLISVADARTLWRVKRSDFMQLVVTFLAVLALGIENGLLLGIAFALAIVLVRSFKPRLTHLGRLPGTDVFVASERFPETRPVPGVVVLRIDGELHFGNVSLVADRLMQLLYSAEKAAVAAGRTRSATTASPLTAVSHTHPTPSPSLGGGPLPTEGGRHPASWPTTSGSGRPEVAGGELTSDALTQLVASGMGDTEAIAHSIKSARGGRLEDGMASSDATAAAGLGGDPAAPTATASEAPVTTPPIQAWATLGHVVADGPLASQEGALTPPPLRHPAAPGPAPASTTCITPASPPASTALSAIPQPGARAVQPDFHAAGAGGMRLVYALAVVSPSQRDGPRRRGGGGGGGGGGANAAGSMDRLDAATMEAVARGGGGGDGGAGGAMVHVPSSQVGSVDDVLKAVVLDASRVVDVDATACRELQTVFEAYTKTKAAPQPALLIAGLPGPVRDTLDRYGIHPPRPHSTLFLTVAAATASVFEREREEEEEWEGITRDMAELGPPIAAAAPAVVAGGVGSVAP